MFEACTVARCCSGDPDGRHPGTPVEYLGICDFGDKGLCGKEPPIVEKWPFLLTLANIYRALTRCQVFFMG